MAAGVLKIPLIIAMANDASPGWVSEEEQKRKSVRHRPPSDSDETVSFLGLLPRQLLFLPGFPQAILTIACEKPDNFYCAGHGSRHSRRFISYTLLTQAMCLAVIGVNSQSVSSGAPPTAECYPAG